MCAAMVFLISLYEEQFSPAVLKIFRTTAFQHLPSSEKLGRMVVIVLGDILSLTTSLSLISNSLTYIKFVSREQLQIWVQRRRFLLTVSTNRSTAQCIALVDVT